MAKVNKTKVGLGVGLGLAAAAAAAGAGYYFYGVKGAEKNRKKAMKWAHDMKADVVKKAKKLQKLDEKAFKTIVDESMKAYEKVKSVNPEELAALASELKQNWQSVSAEVSRVTKKKTVAAKKTVVGAVKSAKKAVKSKVVVAKKAVAKKPAKKVSASKKKS